MQQKLREEKATVSIKIKSNKYKPITHITVGDRFFIYIKFLFKEVSKTFINIHEFLRTSLHLYPC